MPLLVYIHLSNIFTCIKLYCDIVGDCIPAVLIVYIVQSTYDHNHTEFLMLIILMFSFDFVIVCLNKLSYFVF